MALSFTRKAGEGFWLEIDGIEPIHVKIEINKNDCGNNRAKIGVIAEQRVRIYRDEVYVRVLQERNKHQTSEKGIEPCPELLPFDNPPPRNSKNA